MSITDYENYQKRLVQLIDRLIERSMENSRAKKWSYNSLLAWINRELGAYDEDPITPQALNYWYRGLYKQGLSRDSARKLGLLFGFSKLEAAERVLQKITGD